MCYEVDRKINGIVKFLLCLLLLKNKNFKECGFVICSGLFKITAYTSNLKRIAKDTFLSYNEYFLLGYFKFIVLIIYRQNNLKLEYCAVIAFFLLKSLFPTQNDIK